MSPCVQTVVVDNASRDRTLTSLGDQRGLKIIANESNRGFAAAVNQGVRAAEAQFLLLLNPDVKVLTRVDGLVQAADRFGLSAGRLVDEHGVDQKGFSLRSFPGTAERVFALCCL